MAPEEKSLLSKKSDKSPPQEKLLTCFHSQKEYWDQSEDYSMFPSFKELYIRKEEM